MADLNFKLYQQMLNKGIISQFQKKNHSGEIDNDDEHTNEASDFDAIAAANNFDANNDGEINEEDIAAMKETYNQMVDYVANVNKNAANIKIVSVNVDEEEGKTSRLKMFFDENGDLKTYQDGYSFYENGKEKGYVQHNLTDGSKKVVDNFQYNELGQAIKWDEEVFTAEDPVSTKHKQEITWSNDGINASTRTVQDINKTTGEVQEIRAYKLDDDANKDALEKTTSLEKTVSSSEIADIKTEFLNSWTGVDEDFKNSTSQVEYTVNFGALTNSVKVSSFTKDAKEYNVLFNENNENVAVVHSDNKTSDIYQLNNSNLEDFIQDLETFSDKLDKKINIFTADVEEYAGYTKKDGKIVEASNEVVVQTLSFVNPNSYYKNSKIDISFSTTEDISLEDIRYSWSGNDLYIYDLNNETITLSSNSNVNLYLNCESCNVIVDGDDDKNLYLIGNNNNVKGTENTRLSGKTVYVSGLNNVVSDNKIAQSENSTCIVKREYSLNNDEVKTITVQDDSGKNIVYNISSKNGVPVNFQVRQYYSEVYIYGDNLNISLADESTSYVYTYLYGNNSNIDMNKVGKDTNVTVQGDFNIVNANATNSSTDIKISGDGNIVHSSENIPLDGIGVRTTGLNNTIGSRTYSVLKNESIYLRPTYTVKNAETQEFSIKDSSGHDIKYVVSSKDGSEVTFEIRQSYGNVYFYGDNLNIALADESTSYVYTYLYGNNSNIEMNRLGKDTDLIVQGDGNNVVMNESDSSTNIKFVGDNNVLGAKEGVNTSKIGYSIKGENNTIFGVEKSSSKNLTSGTATQYTVSGTQVETITINENDRNITYLISSKTGAEVNFEVRKNGGITYIVGDGLLIELSDESTSYTDTYLYGKNNELKVSTTANDTDIYVNGDENKVSLLNANTGTDITVLGDRNNIVSSENVPGVGVDVNVTGNNNIVGGQLKKVCENTALMLKKTYTVSGTDVKTVTLTDSNGRNLTYNISSKTGESVNFEVLKDGSYINLYGDNLNIVMSDDSTSTTYTYLYGKNNNLDISTNCTNSDVYVYGDKNTLTATKTNSGTDIKLYGDENIVIPTENTGNKGVDVYVTGNNNKIGNRTVNVGEDTNITLCPRYSVSGEEVKTITLTDSNGRNVEYKISSKDGSAVDFEILNDGYNNYVYGSNLKVEVADNTVNDYSVYVNFRCNNSEIILNKAAYSTDIKLIGGSNKIVVKDDTNSPAISVWGDNNNLVAENNIDKLLSVNIKGADNKLNGVYDISSLSGTYNYLCSGAKFIYRNDSQLKNVTAENFVAIFDLDKDGKITKNDLALFDFDAKDITGDSKIDGYDTQFMKKLARMMINGVDSNGNKVSAQLFDLTDTEFTSVENLAQLQFNVENGIDVENSKAAINAIIASEKISFKGKSISDIRDLDNYYEEYAVVYNDSQAESDKFGEKDEVFAKALNNYFTLYEEYVNTYADVLDLPMSGSGAGNINQMKRMMSTFFGTSNDNAYRGKNLQIVASDANLPADLRQAAATLLKLNEEYMSSSHFNNDFAEMTNLCSNPTLVAYLTKKEELKNTKLLQEIATLEGKAELSAEENNRLTALRAEQAVTASNIAAFANNDYLTVLNNKNLIDLDAVPEQEEWTVPKLGETYLEVVNKTSVNETEPVTQTVIHKTLNNAQFVKDSSIETTTYANDLESYYSIYALENNVVQGDVNSSMLQYVLSQMSLVQKMNAVTFDFEKETVTVHVPGELNGRISTPRTYNIADLQQMTGVVYNYTSTLEDNSTVNETTVKSLSSGSLMLKALELATIDNLGAEVFDSNMDIASAWKYLTGLDSKQTKNVYRSSDWDNAVQFTKGDKTYIITNYDSNTKTVTCFDVNDPTIILTKSTSKDVSWADSITYTTSDIGNYSTSYEAQSYTEKANNNFEQLNSNFKAQYGLSYEVLLNLLSQFEGEEEYTATAQKYETQLTEANQSIIQMISDFLENVDVEITNKNIKSVLGNAEKTLKNWVKQYDNTEADFKPFVNALAEEATKTITKTFYNRLALNSESQNNAMKLKQLVMLSEDTIPENLKIVGDDEVDANVYKDGKIDDFKQGDISDCWLLSFVDKLDTVEGNNVLVWNNDGSATVSLYKVDKNGNVGKKCSYTIPSEYLTNSTAFVKFNGENYRISTGDVTVRALELAMLLHDTDKVLTGSNTAIADRMFFGDISSVEYKTEYSADDMKFAYTGSLKSDTLTTVKDINNNDVEILAKHSYSILSFDETTNTVTLANPKNTAGVNDIKLDFATFKTIFDIATNPYTETTVQLKNTDNTVSNVNATIYSNKTSSGVGAIIINKDANNQISLNVYTNASQTLPVSYEVKEENGYTTVNGLDANGNVLLATTIDKDGNIVQQYEKATNRTIVNAYYDGNLVETLKTEGDNRVVNFENDGSLANRKYGMIITPGIVIGVPLIIIGGVILYNLVKNAFPFGSGRGNSRPNSGSANKFGRQNHDPLVFDVNGDGIKTSKEIIDYDIDGDGKTDKINDVQDFILAFDADNDGIIGEDGKELFGNNTDIDGNGEADGYANGFEALKALAVKYNLIGANDTVLDADDLKFLEEKVGMRMKNGYLGQTFTFAELGITEIRLSSTTDTATKVDFDGDGNALMTQEGAVFVINGSEKDYADIWHSKNK